ncbi:MAG: hypothetical protein AAGD96_12665 [Chloroflexota bacterium]
MNDSNNKQLFQKILSVAKTVLDGLIISIFLSIPVILIIGGMNAIFGWDGPVYINGRLRPGLGSDFGLVFGLAMAFVGLGIVLVLFRYPIAIWNWLKERPVIKWSAGVGLLLLIVGWLFFTLQRTPRERLASAVTETNINQVERVLAGGDVDQEFLNSQLDRSIEEGKFEIAAVLIEAGADVNAVDSFREAPMLVSAILFYEKPSIMFLLEQNIDPNQTDENGQTALIALVDYRMSEGDLTRTDGIEIAQMLLAKGADPLLEDDFGRSAKDYAESRELAGILALFP